MDIRINIYRVKDQKGTRLLTMRKSDGISTNATACRRKSFGICLPQ